jgi:hypothetical protein
LYFPWSCGPAAAALHALLKYILYSVRGRAYAFVLHAQQAVLAQEREVALCGHEMKTLALETRVGIVYDDDDGAHRKVARVGHWAAVAIFGHQQEAVTVKQIQAFSGNIFHSN